MNPRVKFRRFLRLIHLEDRIAPAGINSLISRAEPSLHPDSSSGESTASPSPSSRFVSDDGRYYVFTSTSVNLIAGQVDSNNTYDIFLYDRVTDSRLLVSRKAGTANTAGNGECERPVISGDGRYVAYQSDATDLVAGMTVPTFFENNIFLYDRLNDSTKLVSHSASDPLAGSSYDALTPTMSSNGAIVTFASRAVNLTAGFPNPGGSLETPFSHAYIYDVASGQVTLIDRAFGSTTAPGNQAASLVAPSPDGRYILLNSSATNLLSTVTAGKGDTYRYDRQTGELLLLSVNNGTTPLGGNGLSLGVDVSVDGQWILFQSAATNLAGGTTTSGSQLYLHDTQSGNLKLVTHSFAAPTNGGNGASRAASFSDDGRYVTFRSMATDLVANFVSGHDTTTSDIYYYDRVTNQISLVNHQAGSTSNSGNFGSFESPMISRDGRYVTFSDLSTDLVSGFVDSNGASGYDLYRYDGTTGAVSLISGKAGSSTVAGNGSSFQGVLNSAASVIAWTSRASDIMPTIIDTNGYSDLYIRDLTAGSTQLVSRRSGPPSVTAGGEIDWVRQSADGRYIVYTSAAHNLVPGQVVAPLALGQLDWANNRNVFLSDRLTGTTLLVSHAHDSAVTQANGQSAIPVISDDGRYIAYSSSATNIIAGFVDGNGVNRESGTDIYLFDRVMGTTVLVSHKGGNLGIGGNGQSGTSGVFPSGFFLINISPNGRYVSFGSTATDLIAGFVDNNGANPDLYVYDGTTGVNSLVSHAAGNPLSGGNQGSFQPNFSGDGRYIAYWGDGYTMVAGLFPSGVKSVFLYDQQTKSTQLVSHASSSLTVKGNGGSDAPSISHDGRYVVYQSASNNIIANATDTNNLDDVFLFDRITGQNVLVSHTHASATSAGDFPSHPTSYFGSAISGDGRFIVYKSNASNLVQGFIDNNGSDQFSDTNTDVYLYDRQTGINTLISHSGISLTEGGDGSNLEPQISQDGRIVAFSSLSNNLGAFSTTSHNFGQVTLYDRLTATNSLASPTYGASNVGGNNASYRLALSSNGSVVSYLTRANDLIAGDFNGFQDVFSYVQLPPTVQFVQFGDGTEQRSMVKQLVVTFSDPVSFMGSIASAFTLHRQGSVGDVTLTANPASGLTSSVTITFSGGFAETGGSLIDGQYDFMIDAAQVSGVAGALDGNNDGVAGGSYTITGSTANKFYRLFGETDGDGIVTQVDAMAFINAFGPAPSFEFDFNNDGQVNQLDWIQFRNRFGMTV